MEGLYTEFNAERPLKLWTETARIGDSALKAPSHLTYLTILLKAG